MAMRLTYSDGNTRILPLDASVSDPAPTLTVPDDMTVDAGTPVTLQVQADDPGGIASVQWQFSYDGGDWQTDPDLSGTSITYTFPSYGEYDVWVVVTGNDGQTAEDGFHVTANEVKPTAVVIGSGPINEGSAETFTVWPSDPDAADTVSLYADWTGSGQFQQLGPDDLTANADGSLSFSHVYDGLTQQPQRTFAAQIRVENDGGQSSDYTVPVTVTDVTPQATLTAGRQVATAGASGQNVWAIQAGQTLTFTDVQAPSQADLDGLTYHFQITAKGKTEDNAGPGDTFSLPDYTPGSTYAVEGWVTDKAGKPSVHQVMTVVVEDPGDGAQWVIGQPGYFTAFIDGDTPPANYNRFAYQPTVTHVDWADGQPLTILLNPDEATRAFAQARGYTMQYGYTVRVWNIEQHSLWADNYDLESGFPYTGTDTGGRLTLGGWAKDRKVEVDVSLSYIRGDGTVAARSNEWDVVTVITPREPPWLKRAQDTLAGLWNLAQQFGDRAMDVYNAIAANPKKFLNTLVAGATGALKQFVQDLPTTRESGLYNWLLGQSSAGLDAFRGLDPKSLTGDTALSFGLQYAGLTWDHVYQVVLQEVGAGNVVAVEKVVGLFGGPNPLDPNNPAGMWAFVNNLQ